MSFTRPRELGLVQTRGTGTSLNIAFRWYPSTNLGTGTNQLGPVSRKPRKLFGPGKPFLIVCTLKTKKYIGMKLCMKGNFVRIKNMSKEQLCKLKV